MLEAKVSREEMGGSCLQALRHKRSHCLLTTFLESTMTIKYAGLNAANKT